MDLKQEEKVADLVDHLRAELRAVYGGRDWILSGDVMAGLSPLVATLRDLGAQRCLCVATGRGTGELPEDVEQVFVEAAETTSFMGSIRASMEALSQVGPEVQARIDAFDPQGRARVIGPIFDDGRAVGGRRKFAARPAAWQALEDKVTIDALFERVGLKLAPYRIARAERAALWEAADELDQGAGTVWAGDAREGFNGGASYLRWVRTRDHGLEAARFFEAHCDRVRVMPFLEGIPCSIHGIVIGDEVIALRPCEMLVFRRPGEAGFRYSRAATFWDPPKSDRQAMREAAQRVGEHLRESYGYRGVFTLDGIMSAQGFRPTELNPRFGGALGAVVRPVERLPMLMLHMALVEGIEADWRARELEATLVEASDRQRHGAAIALVEIPITEERKVALDYRDGEVVIHEDANAEADATARLGPAQTGGIVIVSLSSERTPVGPAAGPRVAAMLEALDAHWDLGIGALRAAKPVR